MNFKQLTITNKVNSLNFLEPHILHVIPEFGFSTADLIFNSGIRMTNCGAFVSKSVPTKLGNKTFNARQIYLNAKTVLANKEKADGYKVIKVLQELPESLKEYVDEKRFIIMDHTLISQAAQHILTITSEKQALFFFLQWIKKEFLSIKMKYPMFANDVLILLPPQLQQNSILNLLNQLIKMPADSVNDNLKVFDKFIIVSIGSIPPTLLPLANYSKLGKPQIYKQHLEDINEIYDKLQKAQAEKELLKSNDTSSETNKTTTEKPIESKNNSPINNIAKDIQSQNSINQTTSANSEEDEIVTSLDVNQQQLSRILRKYKVKDKVIEDNIRMALDSYLAETKRKPTSENLERIILLAINKTVFNTTEISDEYLQNPAKLFAKLEEVNTYSKPITYIDPKEECVILPSKTIELDRVTGLVRHEYEFSDNIHNEIRSLFKSLEKRSNAPIKVVRVKPTYEDNNLNRTINYEITLQNLAGGFKEPYKVNIKVPALVNDRYFKLNGKTYILSNQQFFIPLTKTDPNETRLLTSYGTMTMSVVNMKFNLSEIESILNYIEIHYPELIIEINKSHNKIIYALLKGRDGNHEFCLNGSTAYEDPIQKVYLDDDTGKWMLQKNDQVNILPVGKSEFLYDRLIELMKIINPSENLKKSPKSIPYIQVYLIGEKLPLIVYLWHQIGLINALTKFGIEYEITTEFHRGGINIALENNKYLYIIPKNKRQELISNGLLLIDKKKYPFSEKDLNSRDGIERFIVDKCGSRSTYNLNLNTSNMIDIKTAEMLEYHDMPTNLIDLTCNDIVDKLLNDTTDSLTDLKIYRSRQAEMMFELMYKALMMAHHRYVDQLKFNKDAKIFLSEEYILECLLGVHPHTKGDSVLELATPYNPIAELKAAAKVIKTG